MKNKEIITSWEEFITDIRYKNYFTSNEEVWRSKLEKVKEYINKEDKRPSNKNIENKEIKVLGVWIQYNNTNYKKRQQIMKNEEIRTSWEEFITDDRYSKYFLSNEEEWYLNLNKVKEYINKEKKRPSSEDKDKEIKVLGLWINTNNTKYKNKKNIMKNKEIRTSWEEFITDIRYKNYFTSNEEEWYLNLNKVKEYINKEKKRPSSQSKDKEIKVLGQWIGQNINKYKNKQYIMKNEEIRTSWEEFIKDIMYKNYFTSNEEEWRSKLEKVKEYMDREKKRPSSQSKDKEIKVLGQWIGQNINKYKNKKDIMKNEEIRKAWEDFIESYPHIFNSS